MGSIPQTQHKTRRKILILGALAGSGVVAAMLTKDLWSRRLQSKFSIQTFTTVTVNSKGK